MVNTVKHIHITDTFFNRMSHIYKQEYNSEQTSDFPGFSRTDDIHTRQGTSVS